MYYVKGELSFEYFFRIYLQSSKVAEQCGCIQFYKEIFKGNFNFYALQVCHYNNLDKVWWIIYILLSTCGRFSKHNMFLVSSCVKFLKEWLINVWLIAYFFKPYEIHEKPHEYARFFYWFCNYPFGKMKQWTVVLNKTT